MRRTESHFPALLAAGVEDMPAALAFRAAERPDAPALMLLERGERAMPAVSYRALHDAARRFADAVGRRTVPGARVLLAFPSGPDFVAALFGCWMAGTVPAPAPPPRGPASAQRLAAIARDCGAALLLSDRQRDAPCPVLTTDELGDDLGVPAHHAPDSPALLQYTSGSTGHPRGAALTHGAIWHNQSVIRTCFDHQEGVVLAGWLPNFHDMGLIGNLLQPIYCGGLSVIMSPTDFTQKPLRWLRAISTFRAHTSGAPNFAYDLCVRAAAGADISDLDLSHWRVAFNGAEPIRARTLEAFADRFEASGFRRTAMMACYGLAESTLMVTGGPVDAGPHVLRISRKALEAGTLVEGDDLDVVSCGDAVAGTDVCVVEPGTGEACADGRIGEVLVRSPSLFTGYWDRPGEGLVARDGLRWLRTGDLAARREGQLYIVGRCKDLLILNGRNVHPADVEDALETALAGRGVRRAVVTGVAGALSEAVLAFLEVSRAAARTDLADLVAAARQSAAALEAVLAGVVLLKPGAAPLTSSGKVRRGACRDLYLGGSLAGVIEADAGALGLRRLAGEGNSR